jgi:hypothetical protein
MRRYGLVDIPDLASDIDAVPITRTITINGTTYDLSADRTWSSVGTNIYNTNGTLTSARTLTSGGFSLTFTGSNTASSAIARGLYLNHTLVAAANNDVLVGLDISPTFTNGAFTGVVNNGLRLNYNSTTSNPHIRLGIDASNSSVISSSGIIALYAQNSEVFYASTVQTIIKGRATTSQLNFNLGTTEFGRFHVTTGNFALQNGGTYTDNTHRLQVTGTSYFSDSVGIGSTSLTGYSLRVAKNFTGATSYIGARVETTIQSDVTAIAYGFNTNMQTAAATFTLSDLIHYQAGQGTIGLNSTVTTQYGFVANSSMTGATTNYGFFGGIASGTNRWNLYMSGTANNYMAGSLGIGSTSLTGISLNVAKAITGSVFGTGINQGGIVQSDVTNTAFGIINNSNSVNAAFTFSYTHFASAQGTIGASSTLSTQTGFLAASSLSTGTNIYGFRGSIPSGTNRWNLYMDGTANNYMAGSLGIGSTALSNTALIVGKSITGTTSSNGIRVESIVASDVTSNATYFSTYAYTATASFTLTSLFHYTTNQGTFGAGSTVTNQYGFTVTNQLIGATNNYGFYGNIAAQTNAWNIYMNGTANNYMAGALAIGSPTSLGGINGNINISKTITGGTVSRGMYMSSIIQSDVTSSAILFATDSQTQSASFTLSNLIHYRAAQALIGSGSSVTTQVGFEVQTSVVGATNNYGFRGLIPSGTNRWNLYMDGTANNYMAGSLGIGTTSLLGINNLYVGKSMTSGTTVNNITSGGVIQSDVTSAARYFASIAATSASSFTISNIYHFFADQGTFGLGSTVTNQYGFHVNTSLTGATNNYAFSSNLAAATGRWNLYMNGTASNYLEGDIGIGTTSLGTATKFTLGGSETAVSNIARGGLINTTLTASANSDVLVGLDISPTFTNGAFTGVGNYGIRTSGQLRLSSYTTTTSYSGTIVGYLAFDSSGNILTTATPSASMAIGGSITSATAGSVLFAGTSGVLAQDNANFFWDDTNNRLGLGTATPSYTFDIPANNTSLIQHRVGTFQVQSYALNNGFMSDNMYYNGTTWTRTTTGLGYGFQFYSGQLFLHGVASGTGSFTQNIKFKFDYEGAFVIGNSLNLAQANYTGATALFTKNGRLLLGTTTESTYILDVNGTFRSQGDAYATAKSWVGTTDTTSPGALTVYSTSAANQIRVVGTTPSTVYTDIFNTGTATIIGAVGGCSVTNNFVTGTVVGDFVVANQLTTKRLYCVSNTGGVYLATNATSWTANSDITLKNINSYIINAVDKLMNLSVINYHLKEDITKKEQIGLIAQEVKEVFPEIIEESETGILGLRYTEIIPILVKAIQELKTEIDKLKINN